MEGLKLISVFVVIMILLRFRVPFPRVMLGSSMFLALLFSTSPKDYLTMVWEGMTSWVTIEMILIVISVMILEYLLDTNDYLKGTLTALQGLIKKRRAVMAILPAFIGLMPSVGGALFSAPLVEKAAVGTDATPEQKSFVNFYFRHTSEYFLPIYPGVILTSGLSGIPLQNLIAGLLPYGVLVILLGIPSLRKIPLPKEDCAVTDNNREMLKKLIKNIWPIIVILIFVLGLGIEVALAVTIVVGLLLIYHRYTPVKIEQVCRGSINKKTILLILSVMIFKEVFTDTNAVNGLTLLLDKFPAPEYLIFCLIIFFVGLLTGMIIGAVGICFPLAMAGMGADFNFSMVILMFISGFAGTMMSPMHLCLPITVEYFKADLNNVLRMLIIPETSLWLIAFLGYLIF